MGGRIIVESVAGCSWNGWPDDRGIRILAEGRGELVREDGGYGGTYSRNVPAPSRTGPLPRPSDRSWQLMRPQNCIGRLNATPCGSELVRERGVTSSEDVSPGIKLSRTMQIAAPVAPTPFGQKPGNPFPDVSGLAYNDERGVEER
ncbi:hypothetical protein JN853_29585 [Pseudomonas syringae pv. actinidiae ICMP 9853]|nr:hypothetical protein JN853_29585 [Pseudomonas syringae pv. actinidiae ICMP 9853]